MVLAWCWHGVGMVLACRSPATFGVDRYSLGDHQSDGEMKEDFEITTDMRN